MAETEFTEAQRAEAYEEARRLIAEAAESGADKLDLDLIATRALTVLPPEIADLGKLKTLDLDNTQVSDLRGLEGLSGLQALWLNNTQISDLRGLEGLRGLQRLWLSNTQVSDLRGLEGLSTLQTLYLYKTQVSDLRVLEGLSGLQTLDLGNTQVSDLTPVMSLKSLRTLSFDGSKVTSIPTPKHDIALEELNLTDLPIENLDFLRHMPKLKKLNLGRTPVMALNPELARAYRSASGKKRVQKIRDWLETQEVSPPEVDEDVTAPPPVLSAKWGAGEDGSPVIMGWAPQAEGGRETLDPVRQKALMQAAAESAGFLKEEAENNKAHPQIAIRLEAYRKAVDRDPEGFIPNTADMLAEIVGGLIADNQDTPEAVRRGYGPFQRNHKQMLYHFPAYEDFENAVEKTDLDPDQVPPEFEETVREAVDSAMHMFSDEIHQSIAALDRKVDAVSGGNEELLRRTRKSTAIALVSIAFTLFGAVADAVTLGADAVWASEQLKPTRELLRKALDMVKELFTNWKL